MRTPVFDEKLMAERTRALAEKLGYALQALDLQILNEGPDLVFKELRNYCQMKRERYLEYGPSRLEAAKQAKDWDEIASRIQLIRKDFSLTLKRPT